MVATIRFGLVCLIAAIRAAALLPMARTHRVLRPLAHVDRLTRLPEYVRVYRVYFFSVILTGALLMAVFFTALTQARDRPECPHLRTLSRRRIPRMSCCVLASLSVTRLRPVFSTTTRTTRNLGSADTRRIGLTSTTLRVIPLTRDYRYAADRLKSLARLARIQQDLDTRKPVSDADRTDLKGGSRNFPAH